MTPDLRDTQEGARPDPERGWQRAGEPARHASAWRGPPPPHSGDAQFYINLADNADLNPLSTRWGYAVFGRVIDGMDVVDRIGVVPTGPMGPLKSDVPQRPVVIEKAEVLGDAAPVAPAAALAPGAAPAAAAALPASPAALAAPAAPAAPPLAAPANGAR